VLFGSNVIHTVCKQSHMCVCVCVCVYTCSSECRDAGRAKEIKEQIGTVNAACRGFVSIATRYGLDGTGIEVLWEPGPGSDAVARTMGTGSLSRE